MKPIRLFATTILFSLLALGIVTGCGSSPIERQTESATTRIQVKWPVSSRFIHDVADTIHISVKSGDTVVASVKIDKPATETVITKLPLDKLSFIVEASQRETPTILSRTELTDVRLTPGRENKLDFTLDSAIYQLTFPSASGSGTLQIGQIMPASVAARDSGGALVLLPPGTEYDWSSDRPDVASVNPRTGHITGVSRGVARITATERGEPRGNGKSTSIRIYVSNPGKFGAGTWNGTYTGPDGPRPLNNMWILFKSDNTVQAAFMGNTRMTGHWSGESVLGCSFSMGDGFVVNGSVSADGKTCTGTFSNSNGSTADFQVQGVAQDGGKNLLVNGSFENSLPTGWTLSNPHYLRTVSLSDYGYTSAVAPHGARVLTFNGAQEPAGSWLKQTFPTVPNATYKLTFAYGKWGGPGPVQRLRIQSLDTTITPNPAVIDDRLFEKPDGAVTVGNPSGQGLFTYGVSMFVHAASKETAVAFTDAGSDTIDCDGLLDNLTLELVEGFPYIN